MSIKFNSVEIPNFINVIGITFSTISDISIQETATPYKVGNYDGGITRGASAYTLDIQLVDSVKPIFQLKRELKKWVKGDNWKPSKLEFEDNPNKYVMARLGSDAEISDLFTHGETSLAFHASDPREYDTELTELSYSTDSFTIEYEGLEESAPLITLTLQEDAQRINLEHEESGREITLTGDFKTNDEIILNNNYKKVEVNSRTAMKVLDYSSNWLYLSSGTNTFNITKIVGGQYEPLNTGTKITYRGVD